MEYQKWLAQALRDLRTAENSLNSGDYYGVVELGYIIRDELHVDVSQIMDNLRELTTHYTTARYPDAANGVPYEIYTEGMARRILEKAREVVEWVRQKSAIESQITLLRRAWEFVSRARLSIGEVYVVSSRLEVIIRT